MSVRLLVERGFRVVVRSGRGTWVRDVGSDGVFEPFGHERDTGTGESHATAAVLLAADQEVHHGGGRPSAVVLPVWRQ